MADLKNGRDNHPRFTREHPDHYQLMYAPELTVPPAAAREAHALPHGILERCAAVGRLTVPPALATQVIMAADVGAALAMLTRPEHYPDARFSDRLRDSPIDPLTRPADTAGAAGGAGPGERNPVPVATLAARPRAGTSPMFTPAETALLQQWLEKLVAGRAARGGPPGGAADQGAGIRGSGRWVRRIRSSTRLGG